MDHLNPNKLYALCLHISCLVALLFRRAEGSDYQLLWQMDPPMCGKRRYGSALCSTYYSPLSVWILHSECKLGVKEGKLASGLVAEH